MLDFNEKRMIGMVHLEPLPGSPRSKDLNTVVDRAIEDADRLVDGGVDGILIENYGDKPYWKIVTEETFSAMMDVCREIDFSFDIPKGVNVLRNDWKSALMIANEHDLDFTRVNVYTGVTLTEQGVIEGEAAKIQRFKKKKNIDADIFADIHVKHGKTIYPEDIGSAASQAVERGLADGVIVSGDITGDRPLTEELERVNRAVDKPVIIGSGLNENNMKELMEYADGAIVGTAFKEGGITENPVSKEKVSTFMDKLDSSFG